MESVGFTCIVLSWLPEFFAVLQGDLGPTVLKWKYFHLQVFLYDVMFLKFHDSFLPVGSYQIYLNGVYSDLKYLNQCFHYLRILRFS